MHPLHPGFLIRPQCSFQSRAGIGAGPLRPAQGAQRLGQPRPGTDMRPVGDGCIGIVQDRRRARQQPHRLGECQTLLFGQRLGLAELPHRAFKALPVDLNPLAAHQHQRVVAGEQRADLLVRQIIPVQRHRHVEIQQPIEANRRWRAGADNPRHLRPLWPIGTPGGGHAHDNTGAFQFWHAGKETRGVLRRPAQGMKDFPRLDHRLEPGACCSGALHRHEQGQKLASVRSPGIVAQGLAERQMLGLGMGGELRCVGGDKGER